MDMKKLGLLSEKVVNEDFTEIEFEEFRELLEEWNRLIESSPKSTLLNKLTQRARLT